MIRQRLRRPVGAASAAIAAAASRLKPLLQVAPLLCFALPASADVRLQDQIQLAVSLNKAAPCCVVDARSEAARAKDPLADAVIYRKGLRIKPTAAVVVIADGDREAMNIGAELERTNKADTVLAVKGGVATWRAALQAAEGGVPAGLPATFVIPKNTCEQGTPLQELRFGK